MSAAEPTPGVGLEGVTPGPGSGESIPGDQVDASQITPSTGDQGSQDYLGRIRAGGDFAAEEVRKHQSRADKMEAEVRKLSQSTGEDSEAIRSLLSQGLTPEMIAAAVTNYFALRSHPNLQDKVLGLERTGMIPDGNSQNASEIEDEYLTDEQREIRELRTELKRVREETAGLTQSTGSAALQNHLERFAQENFLKPDEFEKVKQGMGSQARQWGNNEQGLALLRSLQNPTAYDTVEAVAWKFVPKEVRFQLGERKRLHDQKRVDGFRTDVPSGLSTTGKEPPAEVKGALNALRYAKANPDKI